MKREIQQASSYQQSLARLYRRNLFVPAKLGLYNMSAFDILLDCPHRRFRSIHIAGSNGKGSVATKVAKGLELAGYRTGLFTSPHISSFRERISIDGMMIPEEEVVHRLAFLEELAKKENIPITFFEIITLMAFQYFADEKVDFAVIETGLGGRLDATNIIRPILSIITSISMEHAHILGRNREAIAKEKAGIIKPSIPVIIGAKAALPEIKQIALWQRCPCIFIKERQQTFEEENRTIATHALKFLQRLYKVSEDHINEAISYSPLCRMELISSPGRPDVLLDAAHNPDACERLFQALKTKFSDRPMRILTGFAKTKDIGHSFSIMLKYSQKIHLVRVAGERGMPLEEMEKALMKKGVAALSSSPLIRESMDLALEEAKEANELLVVCGSFFILSDARRALGIEEAHDMVIADKLP